MLLCNNLSLEKYGLPYEIVKVLPFIEEFNFQTDRKDVFCFGSVKMSRVAKKYGWYPGSSEISLYRNGYWINYSDIVDEGALEFCKKMINIYALAEAFVMDICEVLIDNKPEYKIIECGCINSAGFYKANMPKLI
jgi:hypothetical protein